MLAEPIVGPQQMCFTDEQKFSKLDLLLLFWQHFQVVKFGSHFRKALVPFIALWDVLPLIIFISSISRRLAQASDGNSLDWNVFLC